MQEELKVRIWIMAERILKQRPRLNYKIDNLSLRSYGRHLNLGQIVLAIGESNLPLRVYPPTAIGDDYGRPVSLPDSEDIGGELLNPRGAHLTFVQ